MLLLLITPYMCSMEGGNLSLFRPARTVTPAHVGYVVALRPHILPHVLAASAVLGCMWFGRYLLAEKPFNPTPETRFRTWGSGREGFKPSKGFCSG